MYAGSFAASLKEYPGAARFCHFYSLACQRAYSSFTGECFSLFPFTGFICCVPFWLGMPEYSPSSGKQRFNSVTQHNHILLFYSNLHRYSRLSMQWLGMTLQRAAVNQLSRVLCCISSVRLEHPAHNRTYIGSNPLCSTKIAADPFTSVRQLNVKAAMAFSGRRIARPEVRTVSRWLLTGLCQTACFQKSNERSAHAS